MAELSFVDDTGVKNTIVDGDTVWNPEKGLVRLGGFNTREIADLYEEEEGKRGYKRGEVGGEEAKLKLAKLIEAGGFNRHDYVGTTKDEGKRDLSFLTNDKGERIEDYMIALGYASPDDYTDKSSVDLKLNFDLIESLKGRDALPYSEVGEPVEMNPYGLYPKQLAIDESTYDPDIHSGVMFRDYNRTLDNKAKGIAGQAGVSWRTGVAGAKEGVWGYIDALGETFGSEMIESIGESGVMRARDQIMDEPKIIINYKDVSGLMDSFHYVVNNASMSAPYMLATMAAIAASVPATFIGGPILGAAVGYIPISMIYAGHTWNEMEGPKGNTQFAMASVAGVASSVLERLGLRGLMTTEGFLTNKGIKDAAKLYANRHSISETKAQAIISKATRQEQSKYLKGMMALTPEMVRKFSLARTAKRAGLGAGQESFTEVGQEAIQAGTAGLFSDKDYHFDELLDRYINAGLAGGVLGGGLSTAGSLHQQFQDKLKTSDLANWNRERILAIEQKRIRDQSTKGKIETVQERIDSQNIKKRYETSREFIFRTENNEVYKYQDGKSNRISDNKESGNLDTVFIDRQQLAKLKANRNLQVRLEDNKLIFGDRDTAEIEVSPNPVHGLIPIQYSTNIEHIGEPVKWGTIKQDVTKRREFQNIGRNTRIFAKNADKYDERYKGIPNFFKNNKDPFDYLNSVAHGFMRMLIWGAEVNIADEEDLLNHPELLDLNARVGQTNSGVYHSGFNHRGYQDNLLERLKMMVDQNFIAEVFRDETKRWYKRHPELDSENAVYVSKQLKAYGKAHGFSLFEQLLDNQITVEEFKKQLVAQGFDPEIELDQKKLEQINLAALSIQQAYIAAYTTIASEWNAEHPTETIPLTEEDILENKPEVISYWHVNEGLDWYKATKDPHGFKNWLIKTVGLDEKHANDYFENIAYRGTHKAKSTFSLVEGETYIPVSFRKRVMNMHTLKGYSDWSSGNMFEALNKVQVEAAKYNASMRFFGDGGRKLNQIFFDLERKVEEGLISEKSVQQAAWYVKAIIDSTHGNFRRIKDPRWAAMNRFLTNWSIFAGLTLSTLSSIPETAMIWFNIKDDDEWKAANEAFVRQTVGLWSKTMKAEYDNAENNLKRSGISYDSNTVVDRLATGERDMAYVKAHESFFKTIMIKQFTQFQRRMNAAFGMDFIKSGFNILLTAPKNLSKLPDGTEAKGTWASFDFEKFTEYEMRTYNQLKDLGMDVEELMKDFYVLDELKRDNVFNLSTQDRAVTTDFDDTGGVMLSPERAFAEWMGPNATPQEEAFKDLAKKQLSLQTDVDVSTDKKVFGRALEIQKKFEDQLEIGIYKFVNERIQNPQAANRPLFFQDPHYQLLTQFNGFLATFTSNIVPKLWNRQLRKGTTKVKYDTFVLIVTMLALGGASQYLKDLIKFGFLEVDEEGKVKFDLKGTPYLDGTGLAQRALYASGVLGQTERVVDLVKPLYPSRDDWLGSKIFGELGPSARNVGNVVAGTQQALSGDLEKGIRKGLTSAPIIGTLPEIRGGLAQGIANPIDTTSTIWNWLMEDSPPTRSR